MGDRVGATSLAGRPSVGERLLGALPPAWRPTAEIMAFGLVKVPMIFYCRPTITRLDDAACHVVIKLRRRTKNHFDSMYFGALAVGADVAGGVLVKHHIDQGQPRLSLIFKSFSADFLHRPEADVETQCADGHLVADMVRTARESGERVTREVGLRAVCPALDPAVEVARFRLGVSVKVARPRA